MHPFWCVVDSLDEATLTTVRAADGLEAALKAHAQKRSVAGIMSSDGLSNGNIAGWAACSRRHLKIDEF